MTQLDERDMQIHVTILGWLYIAGNIIFLILAAIGLGLLPTVSVFLSDPDDAVILSIIGTVFGVLMVILGLPGVVAGYGLLTRRSWARTLTIVLGILGLVNFPVGTAIGVYTLVVLLQRSATDYFERRPV